MQQLIVIIVVSIIFSAFSIYISNLEDTNAELRERIAELESEAVICDNNPEDKLSETDEETRKEFETLWKEAESQDSSLKIRFKKIFKK